MASNVEGSNVNVFVRVRGLLPDEKADSDINVSGNAKRLRLVPPPKIAESNVQTDFQFDHVFVPDVSEDDIKQRLVEPQIMSLVEGVNVAIMAFGCSGAGKTTTIEGTGGSSASGVIPMAIECIFQLMDEKMSKGGMRQRRGGAKLEYKVGVQYVEIADEKAMDLLSARRTEMQPMKGIQNGEGLPFKDVSTSWAGSATELIAQFRAGQAQRTVAHTDFGPMSQKAAAVFSIQLHQAAVDPADPADRSSLVSQLLVIDTPGAEALFVDQTSLRIKEGPTLNKGALSLGSVVRHLSSESEKDYVDYSTSLFTMTLQEALGGNFQTNVIANVRIGDFNRTSPLLDWAKSFRNITNFPVTNDGVMMGLMHRYHVQIDNMQKRLEAVDGSGQTNVGHMDSADLQLRIHEMEGKILRDDDERRRMYQEREEMRDRFTELRDRYNQLVGSKAKVQEELVSSEEERLQIAKVLIDMQLESTQLKEMAEAERFELTNKLLAYENDVTELELAQQAAQSELQAARTKLHDQAKSFEDLTSEYQALQGTHHEMSKELSDAKTHSDDIAVELLNLNSKTLGLEKALDDANAEIKALSMKLEEGKQQQLLLQADKENLEIKLEEEKSKVVDLEARLRQKELDLEALKVEQSSRVADERLQAAADAKVRGEEVLSLRRQLDDLQRVHATDEEKTSEEARALNAELRQARRRATELEAEKRDSAERVEQLLEENESLVNKLTTVSENYRDKLLRYISDVSELSSAAAGATGDEAELLADLRTAVDSMIQELMTTYSSREEATTEDIKSKSRAIATLSARNRKLYQAYRSLKYQLEDLAPGGAVLSTVHDEERLKVDDVVEEEENRRSQEVQALKSRITTLETQLFKQSELAVSEGEKHVKTSTEMAARNSKLRDEVEALKATMDAASKTNGNGELVSLQKQILDRINSQPKADAGEVQALRSQLDEANRTIQDLNSRPRTAGESDKLKRRIKVLENENHDLEGEIETLRSKIEKLKAELASKPKGAGADSAELKRLEGQIKSLQKIIDEDDMKKMMSEFAETTQAELEAERSELQTKLTLAESEVEELREQLQRKMRG